MESENAKLGKVVKTKTGRDGVVRRKNMAVLNKPPFFVAILKKIFKKDLFL
jgi:hypothetical protein